MASPAFNGKVGGSPDPFHPFLAGSRGARKPMRINLEPKSPEIKAETQDEDALTDHDTPNDPLLSSSHPNVHQTIPTCAPLLAPRTVPPVPRHNRLHFPSESDISALDIGPSLIQTHSQRTAQSLRLTPAPIASRTGFLRVLPVTRSPNTPPETSWSDSFPEITRPDRPRSRLRIEDLEPNAVAPGSASISPQFLTTRLNHQSALHAFPEPFGFRLQEPVRPDRPRGRFCIEDLDSEAVTSDSASISPELLLSNRIRRQETLHQLPYPPFLYRTWRGPTPIAGDIHMLGYGYGYGARKYTHVDLAMNLDPGNNITSASQLPSQHHAPPPVGPYDSYPNAFMAGMADYGRSLEIYKSLEDDWNEVPNEPVEEMNGQV
ncbi:uncharacterized protein N7498_008881 [Penicillium cinerascens]|uniref:Uncharacterized protein n=1 Tax=Penicillium cinerascens TaxID=70096 RepID=A0A9W9MB33_9EURO|nr:uncharacterized protein N7498_008881 [Penicillium cinerascens]KAJ5195443.1 hypothetical protein N7498_008881 [Penicillium cinerascens]